jgi:hypothetical protein
MVIVWTKIRPTNIGNYSKRRVVWLLNKNISKRESMTWRRVQLIRYVVIIKSVSSQNFKGLDVGDKRAS